MNGLDGCGTYQSRSMPVQNALSPAPVSTMARIGVVEPQLLATSACELGGERCIERVVTVGTVERDPRPPRPDHRIRYESTFEAVATVRTDPSTGRI